MNKVLHITTNYPPYIGGVGQVASDIVDSLKGEYEQIVVAFNHEKGDSITEDDNLKIYRIGTDIKIFSQPIAFGYGKKLKKIIKDFNPDIIHFHFPNPFAAHYFLKIKTEAKIVVHYHSDIIKQKFLKKFFIGQTRRLLNKADKIVATSPQYIEYSEFLSLFKEKCVMIPNCFNENKLSLSDFDLEEIKKIRTEYSDKIVCLFVGRHVTYKGLEYLIDAADFIDENIIIKIAGDGVLTPYLKNRAANKNNVKFIGVIKNIKQELEACDIFVFPSITKNEAFGIALAEAMWFAKPAVTFYIEGSGVNYVGLNNITCLECENRNVEQLANAINRLAKDQELRHKLGDNAHKRALELFTFLQFKNSIKNLYSGLIYGKDSD